ncbi:competence type IV pilus assembly protein ComGB [Pisciglobus halotolerans]|uniref:Competence protein ComGB n=1 Tax=Pisciglobus halotolerans TaxID=745365 RepID=A0A1I3CVX3_9LACT|nr:competence type IV pilus assembly protein ComGB [Pisciglobus halotolerans]SFH78597.1 competence protein ComGB [Pisciglobus halotolerans]
MDSSANKAIKNTRFLDLKKQRIQASFLTKLSFLIAEGFTLKDALFFLITIMPKEAEWIRQILKELEEGKRIDEVLKDLAFSERVSAQIYLSMVHGNFAGTLLSGGNYIESKLKQQQQLFKLLQYPVLLLSFMTGIIFAMRLFLLPNFSQLGISTAAQGMSLTKWAFGFIQYFPEILLLFLLVVSILSLAVYLKLRKLSAVKKAAYFAGLPIAGHFFKLYYTQFFSFEWSQLLKSGLQMNDMILLMQDKSTTKLMQEVAVIMEQSLKKGNSFTLSLAAFPFFDPALSMIILHGEATSQLGSELELYAKDCQLQLTNKVQKVFEWIQPLMFMLIASFILCVYLALLLPMFDLLEEGVMQ